MPKLTTLPHDPQLFGSVSRSSLQGFGCLQIALVNFSIPGSASLTSRLHRTLAPNTDRNSSSGAVSAFTVWMAVTHSSTRSTPSAFVMTWPAAWSHTASATSSTRLSANSGLGSLPARYSLKASEKAFQPGVSSRFASSCSV
jgi:hypothetical protein